ncbi:MAG: hypothetical protein ACTHNM_18770 [Dyella sp.]|uniref:hypothetical protein n=1 Tax=Dyella sp. TaxID=1869338 RepID=UPI003F7FF5FC
MREQIIATFESHRKDPKAPYSEDHFLDFLLRRPGRKGSVRDSFVSLRRFNAFIDQVQLDFSVCFSLKDLEANYSLDKFVARVAELQESPRSSLASFKNQTRAGFGWPIIVIGDGILVILSLLLRQHEIIVAICISLLVLLNVLAVAFFVRHQQYRARLEKQLLQAAALRPNNSFKPKR